MKILVAGIGGVGGYFGGLLAREYCSNDSVDIYFLARGENLMQIQNCGLEIITDETSFIAMPDMVSDNVADFGIVDYILICTKTYDLVETAMQLLPAIDQNTMLIPLQNGVESKVVISKMFPNNLVTESCVYLVSRLEIAGKIVMKGNNASLFFGADDTENDRLKGFQNVIVRAGIVPGLSKNITRITWEKFILLSSIATATTYFDLNIHDVLQNEQKCELLTALIDEVTNLAVAKKVDLGKNQTKRIIEKLHSLPLDATTSMHTDFQNKKIKTELGSLTGYVVREGAKNNIDVRTFSKMYSSVKKNYC